MLKITVLLLITYALALFLSFPIAGLVNIVVGYHIVTVTQVFLSVVATRLFLTAVR